MVDLDLAVVSIRVAEAILEKIERAVEGSGVGRQLLGHPEVDDQLAEADLAQPKRRLSQREG